MKASDKTKEYEQEDLFPFEPKKLKSQSELNLVDPIAMKKLANHIEAEVSAEGYPLGSIEQILRLSLPPYYTA